LSRHFSLLLVVSCHLALSLCGANAALARVPEVRFQLESPAYQDAAERCAEIWRQEGPGLAESILPAGVPADTVLCLILDTESFKTHFAGRLPDWGVGAAMPGGRVIALDFSRLPAVGRGLREVFLHEMVHALLFQGAGRAWLPAWFHEGSAMVFAGEWRFSDTVSLVLDGQLPSLGRLQGRFPVSAVRADRAYRTSLLAVSRLIDQHGVGVVAKLIGRTRVTGEFVVAFEQVTGTPLETWSRDFATAMRLRFGWLVTLTRWPTLFVLLALILSVGAVRKIIISRRRLARMDEPEEPVSGI